MPVSSGDILDYFVLAYNSIINQTFTNFQLILCIDGPIKNEIDNFISSITDPRVVIFKNTENIGLAAILNKSIKSFFSDIYFRMDSDDISKHDRFEKTIRYLENNPDVLLVGTECIEIDEHGNKFFHKKVPSGFNNILEMAYTRNPYLHPSMCIKRKFFDIVGFYDENLKKSQDYELIIRALINNVVIDNIPEPLILFRISGNLLQRRSGWVNIKNEFKISMHLIMDKNKFDKLPYVFAKMIIRIIMRYMPVNLYKIMYQKLR